MPSEETNFPVGLWRYPITYDKLRERCKLYHNPNRDNCGEALFRGLPLYVTENLTCRCDKDYREHVETFASRGIPSVGNYCTNCGLPTRYSIVNHFFVCEGCDKYFTYDYREFTEPPPKWPLPNLLCKDCDVPVAVHRPRGTKVVFY